MSKSLLSLNHHIATLQHGPLSLKVNAQHGARIISFAHENGETLTQGNEHPDNFGSTLWDAPQSRWHWPPPVTLDSGPYTARISENKLEFNSGIDQASGLQFSKLIRALQDDGIEIEYRITNAGNTPIATAAWEVTRSPGGLTFCPAANLASHGESTLPGVQLLNLHAWYQIDPAPLSIGKKAFFDVREGWLAHVLPNRLLFLKSFSRIDPEEYSPGHTAVEVYAHIDGAYVELENHGPRTLLQPQASLSYVVRWLLQPLAAHIDVRPGNPVLIEFAQEILRAQKS